ncbi:type ISP restriction/modification enzyme [Dermabacteraceae bacterium P13095]
MDHEKIKVLATTYLDKRQEATTGGIAAEPEAQLTVPLSNFLTAFTYEVGLGELGLIREAQLDGIRPDFAATHNKRPCGWIELKAPGHTLIGDRWRGREKNQWELLSQLDALIVTDGIEAVFYSNGIQMASCALPWNRPESWDFQPLRDLMEKFLLSKPTPIKRVGQLAERLAPLARFIRERIDDGLENNTASVIKAKEAWDHTVHSTTNSEQFPSDVAQVIAYSMVIAGLSGRADINNDGIITLKEAKETLKDGHSNVLAAALGPILDIPGFTDYIEAEVGAIVRLISCMDINAIHSAKDSRGEPWLWFYEDFLAKYDPEARKSAGVYYTPTSVVQFQVRTVDHLLRTKFDRTLGFGASNVHTLDPAAGSGTYPLAIIDQAVKTGIEERGPAGGIQAANNLTKNLLAFEILPGPYAVTQLRLGQRLAQAKGQMINFDEVGVYLTDTLEDPYLPEPKGLFGDALVLAEAAAEARKIKNSTPVTVAIGNPPYDRGTSDSGGWVLAGRDNERPIFDDVIKPAQQAGVVFSAQASLYNLYIYFWRWAIWKVFQQGIENDSEKDAIISFITASSWLTGPGFVGLRQLAVDTSSEIWVLDLGGEGRGARKEENVFDIQSPVAIVTLVRTGKASKSAKVYYRRLRGTRQEKFDQLDRIDRYHPDDGWSIIDAAKGQPFIADEAGEKWSTYPLLADLFPWQQPGIKYNRMWPVAPSHSVLEQRWEYLLADNDPMERAARYVTATTGRTIHTKVSGLPLLADLPSGAKHEPIVRMGWRSFDQQWTFDDPRLINLERPSLWQSLSTKQLFLVSPWTARISEGPAATVSIGVPDLHYFRGSFGGKDVLPLYRDAAAKVPNITKGLLDALSETYGRAVSPEDLLAYCFAVIASSQYSERFVGELENSPVRVPLTKETALFEEAVALGSELLWLQTYGQRYAAKDRPESRVPRIPGLGWTKSVTTLPSTTKDISYDEKTNELRIADGIIAGVLPEVRKFSVSGMNILDKWLGTRTRKGIGRASSKSATPLDKIRSDVWEDEWNDELLDLLRVLTRTVELGEKQGHLLTRIVEGDLIDADKLPVPTSGERKVPATIQRQQNQQSFDI